MNYDLDVHHMSILEAKKKIEKTVVSLSDKYTQITVIHGYSNGNQILSMVRSRQLNCKRIKQKILTLNQGETILVLNKKSKPKN